MQELRGLRLSALSKRALSMGIPDASVDEAMDADDSKAALVGLIVATESKRGPAERMLLCLENGGEECAAVDEGGLRRRLLVLLVLMLLLLLLLLLLRR